MLINSALSMMPVQLNSCLGIGVSDQLFRWPLVRIWLTGYERNLHSRREKLVIWTTCKKSPVVYTCGISVLQDVRRTRQVLGGL